MTKVRFTLIAVALALAYAVLFFATREPVCKISSANRGTGRSGVSSVYCEQETGRQ